jgi:predicted aldo/keto reductase-like oxidoreductase
MIHKMSEESSLPKRSLGRTGEQVTILGLGGEGVLRTFDQEEEAVPLIHRAIDLGITYFESEPPCPSAAVSYPFLEGR